MLDHHRRLTYYFLACCTAAAVGGCGAGLPSIAPAGLVPMEPAAVAAWRAGFAPAGPRRYDLRWRFYTPKGSTAGRATVRIAPPDSLRFDYRGPFGRSGAALLLGDSVVWAEPEKDVRELIPLAPLFWAALGIPLAPPGGAVVAGLDGIERRAWREMVGGDTLDVVHTRTGAGRLLTQLRRGGVAASTEVRFGAERLPIQGEMRFPKDGAAFVFSIQAVDTTVVFDAATWRRP